MKIDSRVKGDDIWPLWLPHQHSLFTQLHVFHKYFPNRVFFEIARNSEIQVECLESKDKYLDILKLLIKISL